MAKSRNAELVAMASNPMNQNRLGSNYTAPKERVRTSKRSQNASVVERKDSRISCNEVERAQYATQMKQLYGCTKVPAVLYKGNHVPRRVLSDYSYLTGAM